MIMANESITDLVKQNDDGSLRTTSLIVAERFGKEHFHVLKAIENLECSQEFRASNFRCSSYLSRQGKTMPMIEMTRDGFMFLAMGFTGREAAQWKEQFIHAFNKLEKYVNRSVSGLSGIEIAIQRYIEVSTEDLKNIVGSQIKLDGDIRSVKGEVADLRSDVGSLRSDVVDLATRLAPRKSFSTSTQNMFNLTVAQRYSGKCPCCQKVQIIDERGMLIKGVAHYEHWNGKQRNWPSDGWLVCKTCNTDLETNRHSKRTAFDRFQELMNEVFGSFEQLDIFNKKVKSS
jgi:Rha family phage regulatory protein